MLNCCGCWLPNLLQMGLELSQVSAQRACGRCARVCGMWSCVRRWWAWRVRCRAAVVGRRAVSGAADRVGAIFLPPLLS